MAKFDKEIKAAKKIGTDWIKESERYQGIFESIKKDSLALEKGAIGKIQAGIQKGEHNQPKTAKAFQDECDVIRERLDMFLKTAKSEFDKHEKWALKEPRSSMGFIATKLKLGKPKDEMYDAVADALKRQLTDVANAISQTQRAFNNDLKFALKTQRDRLAAIEKVLRGDAGKHGAFIAQIKKETKRYVDFCDKTVIAATGKVGSDGKDLQDAKSGKLNDKDPKMLMQKYQVYEKKRDTMPQLIAIIEKNHKRVLKSVPKQFIDGFMTSAEKKQMEEKKKESLLKIKTAQKLYTMLCDAFEQAKLV